MVEGVKTYEVGQPTKEQFERNLLARLTTQLAEGKTTPTTGATAGPTDKLQSDEIFPEPGFVIKCKTKAGDKVFINLCSHTAVPNTKKCAMFTGEEKKSTDKKSGAATAIYDIVVHPDTLLGLICEDDAAQASLTNEVCVLHRHVRVE